MGNQRRRALMESSDSKVQEAVDVWAMDVMVWLRDAVRARAFDVIAQRMEDVISAFMVTVRPQFRKLVLEVIKEVVACLRQRS